ncbi:MAG: hypothetical protein MJZ81_01340 [Bacteroidales bacterium]|nr:hypothetical protein [Bacteroidales bacterium]
MKRTSFIILSLLVSSILLSSCRGEYGYAQQLLSKHQHNRKSATEKIYVCLPTEVIHTNSSLGEVKDFAAMSEGQQDSVILSLTKVLNKIDDSLYLYYFNQSFLYTLSRTCIPIVLVSDESKLPAPSPEIFTISIPQLEAEEYVEKKISHFTTRNGNYFSYSYNLQHFSTNAWFLFGGDSNTYFKNKEIAETFRGVVDKLSRQTNQATLKAHIEHVTPGDVYNNAYSLGEECALYYIEYLLARYAHEKNGTKEYYYFYNRWLNEVDHASPYEQIASPFDKLEM